MGVLTAVVVAVVVAGVAIVLLVAHAKGDLWVVRPPTLRQIRLLRRGRNVPGRFMWASLIERRGRRRKLP